VDKSRLVKKLGRLSPKALGTTLDTLWEFFEDLAVVLKTGVEMISDWKATEF